MPSTIVVAVPEGKEPSIASALLMVAAQEEEKEKKKLLKSSTSGEKLLASSAAADTAAELQAAERRGKLGNALTVAGAATAGVFAAAGVTLVVLGKRGARRGGRTAGIWVSPSTTATFTGLRLGGSF